MALNVSDPASWAPNLTPDQFWNERSYLAGILIGAVAYGVHATLFFLTLTLLWARPRTHWKDYIWITYTAIVFIVSSLGNGGQFKFTQMIWIDNREYPGGPGAYFAEQSTAFESTLCNAAYIVNGWLQDALILYRFYIIFGGSVMTVLGPVLVFLGEMGVSIALLIALTTEGKTIRNEVAAQLFTSYFAISISLNVLLTLAIVAKLLFVRRRIKHHLQDSSSTYVSVSAMLIESASLYAVCGILFLVPWRLKSPVQSLVLPTLGQAESIAPLLIILRVAQGQAWSADTESRLATSTIKFSSSQHMDTIALSSANGSKGASTTRFHRGTGASEYEEDGVKVEEEIIKKHDV
ncbi:hypothetical protein EXIGLDRAFT_841253 [Exidia glandulosa HHB12029]|uniref:Uncharacterized protein n=1 Tax=Exidia glandulosa HHB12029 TaxID=1314781 RepID=A0A165DZB3_EXIGL|nr:hypothetical protein EXIGLDRAFT_841253 [Exidia glandulosa HHB12029]